MKKILVAISLLCLMSCSHIVVEGDAKFIITKCEIVNSSNGKYKYHVLDKSNVGWELISNKKFAIGDTIDIIKNVKNLTENIY